MSIVKLLKLLEKKGCTFISVERKLMDLTTAQKHNLPYDHTDPNSYWDLKIQIPADKKAPSE